MKKPSDIKESNEAPASRARICQGEGLWTRVVAVVMVWSLFITCMNIPDVLGSEELDPYRGFVDGTVTAIREKSIYINDRPYAVKSGVEVKDQYGQAVEYQKIETGDHVRYLVQDGMIVKIIVIQPS